MGLTWPVVLAVLCGALLLAGPGRLAVDRYQRKH